MIILYDKMSKAFETNTGYTLTTQLTVYKDPDHAIITKRIGDFSSVLITFSVEEFANLRGMIEEFSQLEKSGKFMDDYRVGNAE